MIAAGRGKIVEAAVIGDGEEPCVPCGGCRQRLREFMPLDATVHLLAEKGARASMTLEELLPRSFGPGTSREDSRPRHRPGGRARRGRGGRDRRPRPRRRSSGLILGSGLGGLADAAEDAVQIDYSDLPGFPEPGVAGHGGRLVLGRLGGLPVAILQGRKHIYEGGDPGAMRAPVRAALQRTGALALLATNAAGSLRPESPPGSLMAIGDHINMLGVNPLSGPNDDDVGPRFEHGGGHRPGAARAAAALRRGAGDRAAGGRLSRRARSELRDAGRDPRLPHARRRRGRDVDRARGDPRPPLRAAGRGRLGDRNLAEGMGGEALSHEQTLKYAAKAAGDLSRLVEAFCEALAR